jgi:predicted transcriptional regulator
MAACVVSTLFFNDPATTEIYTMKLSRRGVDLFEEESHNVLKSLYVHDIIDREPEILRASADLATVLDRALESTHTEYFVVNERDELIGTIHLRELTRMLVEQEVLRNVVVAGDLVEPYEATVSEHDDLDVVMQMFSHGLAEELPIVASDNPTKLMGSVHKRDMIQAYNQEVLRRDLAGQVSSTVLVASRGQQVELGGGYVLQEILPPPRFFGKTIRQLDIAAAWGVHVVLLRKREPDDGGPAIRVPTADDHIQEGDRLVVSGTKAAVESLDVT